MPRLTGRDHDSDPREVAVDLFVEARQAFGGEVFGEAVVEAACAAPATIPCSEALPSADCPTGR